MECLSACKLIWSGAQKDQEPGSHGALKGNSSFLGSKQSRTWELWADWAVSGLLKAARLCGLPQNWELQASAKSSPVTWQAELPCCIARAGCTAEAVSVCFLFDFTCFISLSEPEVNWVVVFSILVFGLAFSRLFVVPRSVILSPHWGLLSSWVSQAAFAASGQGVGAEEAASPGLRDYFRAISSLTHFSSGNIAQRQYWWHVDVDQLRCALGFVSCGSRWLVGLLTASYGVWLGKSFLHKEAFIALEFVHIPGLSEARFGGPELPWALGIHRYPIP